MKLSVFLQVSSWYTLWARMDQPENNNKSFHFHWHIGFIINIHHLKQYFSFFIMLHVHNRVITCICIAIGLQTFFTKAFNLDNRHRHHFHCVKLQVRRSEWAVNVTSHADLGVGSCEAQEYKQTGSRK